MVDMYTFWDDLVYLALGWAFEDSPSAFQAGSIVVSRFLCRPVQENVCDLEVERALHAVPAVI